ncbi:MAG: acyl-CoA thioesterase [Gammaproteobacteria bacterium]|nr:acyl-CoA thioesterase [Gammaproteobacteria bacterium]
MTKSVVERRIMWGDLDSLGIVFYPRYYEWLDASGHLFFESIGLDLGTLWNQRQIQFGLIETGCQYASPGRYHQSIRIVTQLDSLSRKTLVLKSVFEDVADDRLMVTGTEKRICMNVSDPQRIRATEIPDDIRLVLERALAPAKH